MKRLQAVNAVLTKLKQPTVTSVNTQHPLVGEINTALDSKAHKLLIQGFWFNVSTVTLLPDVSGKVQVPESALLVSAVDSCAGVLVVRGGYLWHMSDNTDLFAGPVLLRVHWGLEFEDLPEPAAEYVQWDAAAEVYSNRYGVDDVAQGCMQNAQAARNLLDREHLRNMRYNSVKSSPAYSGIISSLRGL